MRKKLDRVAGILSALAILLVLASFFSVPIPFVRLIWIREVWGVSGLFHALIFFVLARRISKVSVAAPLAAIGMVLNEQIRTVLSYACLKANGSVSPTQTLFFAGSLFFELLLLWMLGDLLKALLEHKIYYFKNSGDSRHTPAMECPPVSWGALSAVGAGYAVLASGFFSLIFLTGSALYGALKVLSALVSLYSFAGAGQEINFYLEGRQGLYGCAVKIASHLLLLSAFLWVVYRKLPVISVLIFA